MSGVGGSGGYAVSEVMSLSLRGPPRLDADTPHARRPGETLLQPASSLPPGVDEELLDPPVVHVGDPKHALIQL